MPLSRAQQTIADDHRRFKVACCGRRFGKTTLAIREICKIAREPNSEVYYVSPSYRMSKTIVFKKLKAKLMDLRWVKKINETELTFILKNGSTISLKGADNYDSLRGVGLDGLIMDEAADIDAEAWYEVLRPALSDRQGRALFLGTPKGFNWFKDIFDLSIQFPEEWASFQFTTIDGGNVPESEIESAKRDLDARTFAQEYLGTFQNYAGRIYYAFESLHNVQRVKLTDPTGPFRDIKTQTLHIGVDFNVSPLCAVIAIRSGDNLYVIDEIQMYSSNTHELADEIRARYPTQNIVCYPDPAGAARKTSAGGLTDHTILRNAGFTVKSPHRHTPVKDRINAVNSRLCDASGVRHLFFDPSVKNIIQGLERHVYKEGTVQPDKDSGYDHMTDSLGYMVDFLFPITRDTSNIEQPRNWTHGLNTTGAHSTHQSWR